MRIEPILERRTQPQKAPDERALTVSKRSGWLPKIIVHRDRIELDDGNRHAEPLPQPPLANLAERFDVRAMTPREMVDLSYQLYTGGFLDKRQYRDLAFQSELMPNYDATIGALTGEFADPQRPRDYTAVWRARLRFESTYSADDPRIIERTQQILEVLESIVRWSSGAPESPSPPPEKEPADVDTPELPPALMSMSITAR